MEMKDAENIMNNDPVNLLGGFMVSFERVMGGMLHSDHFPDKRGGEDLIETEEEAWILARKFAEKTKGSSVNIYVIGDNFIPVNGYEEKYIKNR